MEPDPSSNIEITPKPRPAIFRGSAARAAKARSRRRITVLFCLILGLVAGIVGYNFDDSKWHLFFTPVCIALLFYVTAGRRP